MTPGSIFSVLGQIPLRALMLCNRPRFNFVCQHIPCDVCRPFAPVLFAAHFLNPELFLFYPLQSIHERLSVTPNESSIGTLTIPLQSAHIPEMLKPKCLWPYRVSILRQRCMGDSINRGPPRQTSTYHSFTYRQEFLISGMP